MKIAWFLPTEILMVGIASPVMADETECQVIPIITYTFTQFISPIETSYAHSPKHEDYAQKTSGSEHGPSMRQVHPERQEGPLRGLLEIWACWQVGNRESSLVQSLSWILELARALGIPVEEREARHRRLRARCELYVCSFDPGYYYCMRQGDSNLVCYLWKKVQSGMTNVYMAINWLV
ncbi:unnamed protein product [Clonostachys chloroleuca]|uniref:Uncharacterized protein n=1 Tax=Clonostachys chloroleuca TaxID=1926264 RepID=A0AA35QBB0_9HYPO|nr:unnamed protein product [Clonostachys chloroleuca]